MYDDVADDLRDDDYRGGPESEREDREFYEDEY